jgi:hypothetical protein
MGDVVFNAGDVNNDGIDDLVINSSSTTGNRQVAVFFGRANPQSTPDVTLTLPSSVEWVIINPLGDINGDNRADLSLDEYTSTGFNVYVWTDVTSQPWLFRQSNNINWRTRFCGIGDVNGDSLADCYMFMPINQTGQTHNRLSIYFGNLSFPQTDSLIICNDTNHITSEWGCALGDVNNDGYSDFVAYDNHLWLGGSNLTSQWDVALSAEYGFDYGFSETCTGYPFVHGDLNGDGFEDIISSNSIYGGHSGVLTVWMGRSQMNGTLDLLIPSPNDYPYRNFGYSKVTGDFNADGFCDIAVGAPWFDYNDHWDTGRVYVYAGNAELEDTTVANDDNVAPVIEQDWKLDVYPNPVSDKLTLLTVKFSGQGYKDIDNLNLDIFNVRGQKIYSQAITSYQLKSGSVYITPGLFPQGMLIVKASHAGKPLTATKVIIL